MGVRQAPAPGSIEALKQGCLCPVLDNCHGNVPPSRWRIWARCPVHAPTGKRPK